MSGRNREPSTTLPSGSASDRNTIFSSPEVGNIFYNTDTSNVEIYHQDPSNNAAWRDLVVNNRNGTDISGVSKVTFSDNTEMTTTPKVSGLSYSNNIITLSQTTGSNETAQVIPTKIEKDTTSLNVNVPAIQPAPSTIDVVVDGTTSGQFKENSLEINGDGEFARDLYAGRDLDVSGSIQMSNAPIAVAGRSAGTVNGGTFVPNNALINRPSSFLNTSNGRFTVPSGYAGFYLFTYTGLGAQYHHSPRTAWYKNGNLQQWGGAHTNSSNITPLHWGISCQVIFDLSVGDYVELKRMGGSLYGSSTAHSTIIALYLFSK